MIVIGRIVVSIAAFLPVLAMFYLVVSAVPALVSDAGTASLGALLNVLSNTFWIVLSATALAWMLALPCVLISLANPVHSRTGGFSRQIIDFGSCFPRLLWGLAGAGLFGGTLGLGVSALTGILTLGCLLAPIVATTLQDGCAIKARTLMTDCLTLGMTKNQAILFCIVPGAVHSVQTALSLSLARGIGDAAAVILTAGSAFGLATSLSEPGATLSVFLLVLVMETPGQQHTAYAAAALLFGLSAFLQLIPGRLVLWPGTFGKGA